jgi:hypothetical protein
MTPSRWSTILRRVTTEGPYINERMSVLVLTVVVLAGISAVAFADKARGDGRRWMSCLQPAEEIVLSPAALILPLGFSKAHGQSVYSIMNLAHIAPAITENQTAHQRRFRIAR